MKDLTQDEKNFIKQLNKDIDGKTGFYYDNPSVAVAELKTLLRLINKMTEDELK